MGFIPIFGLLVGSAVSSSMVALRKYAQSESVVPESYRKQAADTLAQNPDLNQDQYWSTKKLNEVGKSEAGAKGVLPKLVRGNPNLKTVALTFDDGPYPQSTPKLLEVLKKADVKATMFVIGYKVEKYPALVREMAKEGHEMANHTYSHFRLPTLSAQMVDKELYYGAATLTKFVPGIKTADICRPPGGQYNGSVLAAAKKHGYTVALWTDDPGDYANLSKNEIERRVLRDIDNGGIILLHDDTPATLAALPDILAKIKARGYRFVTCSEMMNEGGSITNGGPNTYTPKS